MKEVCTMTVSMCGSAEGNMAPRVMPNAHCDLKIFLIYLNENLSNGRSLYGCRENNVRQ